MLRGLWYNFFSEKLIRVLFLKQLSDFHELSRLKHLPLLKEVSLRDLHFGVCPVTQLDGYRNAVLLSLPQLMVLDGIEVRCYLCACASLCLQRLLGLSSPLSHHCMRYST